jgi:Putative zinc-finger
MTQSRVDAWNNRVHQQVWELLPWYGNGTLTGQELHDVEAHLTACHACQTELTRCHDLAAAVRASEDVAWSPSPAHVARVLARIEAVEARRTWRRDWWQGVCAWGLAARGVLQTTPFSVRWTLAAQGVLVVLLASALVWQMSSVSSGQYRTLSAGNDHVPQNQGQIRVVFAEDMTEHELRALLTSMGGTIVQGPSPLGVYTVGILQPGNRADLVRLVQMMQAHPKVRLAEPITVR